MLLAAPRYSVVYDTSTRGTFDSELQRCELATPPDACEPRVCAVDPRLSPGGNKTECTLAAEDDDACTVCLHAALGSEPAEDVLGFIALFFAGVMAGMSGIGGGGLNVPLLLLLMDWTVNEASVLSHVAVFGAAIAQNLFNLPRRHPLQPRRPLVDFDLPLLLLPPQLCGNAFGITLRPVFGATMLEAVATVVLLAVLVKTWRRACAMWREEQAEEQRGEHQGQAHDEPLEVASERPPPPSGGSAELLALKVVGPSRGYSQFDSDHGSGGGQVFASGDGVGWWRTLRATASALPALHTSLLLAAFSAIFTLANIAVETVSVSGSGSCNATVWTLTLLIDAVVGLLVAHNLRRLRRQQLARDGEVTEGRAQGKAGGGARARGDLDYSSRMVLVLPAVAFLVGAISGLLGLGGGEMMAPLLLMLGLLPQVASATSAFMILFTSCSNVAYYVWHGELSWFQGYQWCVPAIAFVASLVGRTASVVVAARLSHPSVIAFALALVLAVSILLLIMKAALAEAAWAFGSLCSSEER